MRTFVALNLPQDERARLHASLEPLRTKALPMRWADVDSLHVTVHFLGDTDGAGVAAIDDVLRTAAEHRGPVTLRIGGLGAFPSLRRASILWVGIAPDPELTALQRELEPALSRLGYPREQRPFRPHITIGRMRTDSRAADIERLSALADYEATVTVETVDLVQSVPGAGGSRYDVLLRRRLGERKAL
ncbi:MAG: RNA 2',3'-cyclic phosphodiesterase [Longimicrobiales bacterium]